MKIANITTEMEQAKIQKPVKTENVLAGNSKSSEEGVSLQISEEAMQKYREKLFALQQMDAIREQNEESHDMIDDIGKIMLIFRRIADGDIVPPQDERKLMEHSSEMYHAAKNLGMLAKNEDPEEYDSVDEGEEEDSKGKVSVSADSISMPSDMDGMSVEKISPEGNV